MSQQINPPIDGSWKNVLVTEFQKSYFLELKAFLEDEMTIYTVLPKGKDIFNAFNLTPFHKVRVVILGQDPYHSPGQAHGLCFSVPNGAPAPPSLVNILKELKSDLGTQVPRSSNLESWARQGVLMLNATLTVRAQQAGSHQKKGWETFTNTVISKLSEQRKNIVFLLWGASAQVKIPLIDSGKHHILTAPHPSPRSAHRGFLGCRHFSKTNIYLKEKGIPEVDWEL